MDTSKTIAHESVHADGRAYTRIVRHLVHGRACVLAVLILAAGLTAACLPGTSPAVAPGTRACIGLPQATCARAFEEAETQARERGTVVVGIVIRCTTVCTEASGEAEQSVRFADGTIDQGGFGWQAADPAPVGEPPRPEPSLPVAPTCVGLDPASCETRALESMSTDQGLAQIVAIVIRCAPGPCTPEGGEGDTTITYADGASKTSHWIYSGSP